MKMIVFEGLYWDPPIIVKMIVFEGLYWYPPILGNRPASSRPGDAMVQRSDEELQFALLLGLQEMQ